MDYGTDRTCIARKELTLRKIGAFELDSPFRIFPDFFFDCLVVCIDCTRAGGAMTMFVFIGGACVINGPVGFVLFIIG